jgi:hypothetical protein
MVTTPHALVVAGLAAAIFASTTVFAAKTPLSDEVMDGVYAGANNFTFNGNANSSMSLSGGANANIQFNWYQWSDTHAADGGINNNANNQSGDASHVQQNLTAKTNALMVGAVAQNILSNSGGDVAGSQTVMSYAVFNGGGF